MILKPSEVSPRSCCLIREMVPKYLDSKAIRVIMAGPEQMGPVLEARFDKIFYTGSTRVGRIVAAAAAKHLTPCVLELGGQGPAVVCKSADINTAAARIASAKFTNAGQICLNVNHIFLHPDIAEAFTAKVIENLKTYLPNEEMASNGYSKIIDNTRLARVEKFLQNTKGKIIYGGEIDRSITKMYPTVVTQVRPGDSLLKEELFAPIFPIVEATTEEAISLIQDGEHPLCLYVFTSDAKERELIINNTLSGGVTVNDTFMHAALKHAPFGGVGESGYGYAHGKYGVLAFSHLRTVFEMPTWHLLDSLMSFRYPPHPDSGKGVQLLEKDIAKKVHFGRNESVESQAGRKTPNGALVSAFNKLMALGGGSKLDAVARWLALVMLYQMAASRFQKLPFIF